MYKYVDVCTYIVDEISSSSTESKDAIKKVRQADKSPVLPSREIKRDLKTVSATSPTPPLSKDPPPSPPSDQEQKKILKLHTCATCQKEEETVKTFKRCQRYVLVHKIIP